MKPKKPNQILIELKNGLNKYDIVALLDVSHGAVQAVINEHPEFRQTKSGHKTKAGQPKKEKSRPLLSVRVSADIFDKIERFRENNGETRTVFVNKLLEEWGSV